MFKDGLKGSYTVEASLVFPIVLFAVLFVIYSAFYLHNQMIVHETAYETAIYATTLNKTNVNDMKNKVREKYIRSIEGRLISMRQPNISIAVKNDKITVKIAGEMNTAQGSLLPNYDHTVISAEKTVSFLHPVNTVRLLNKLKGITQQRGE